MRGRERGQRPFSVGTQFAREPDTRPTNSAPREHVGALGWLILRLSSWVGFAVAVELWDGLVRLLLVRQPSYWHHSYPPTAARPAPCGLGSSELRGRATYPPSQCTVVRVADTCLLYSTKSPPPW